MTPDENIEWQYIVGERLGNLTEGRRPITPDDLKLAQEEADNWIKMLRQGVGQNENSTRTNQID